MRKGEGKETENSRKEEYRHTHSVPGNGHEEIQERESILILLQRRKDSIINK